MKKMRLKILQVKEASGESISSPETIAIMMRKKQKPTGNASGYFI